MNYKLDCFAYSSHYVAAGLRLRPLHPGDLRGSHRGVRTAFQTKDNNRFHCLKSGSLKGPTWLGTVSHNGYKQYWAYPNFPAKPFVKHFSDPDNGLNSLRPSDAIWRQRTGSTLAQVMAWCLTAPSHCLNQCWLIISKVPWHSCEDNFTRVT